MRRTPPESLPARSGCYGGDVTTPVWLLLLHGLCAVALLGAISHQALACAVRRTHRGDSFVARYVGVAAPRFVNAIVALYAATFVLGSLVYPAYRVDVRIPLEEMALGWAVGTFELKEHFGGVGLATLPLYRHLWAPQAVAPAGRAAVTWLLAAIVWFDFLSGHVINNLRGL